MNPLAPSLLDQDATPATIRGALSSWPREGGDDLLQQATAHARRLIQNDRAPASHDKYARCWGQFVRWLGSDERLSSFEEAPAKPFIIGMYIGALRARGLSKNSVLVHLAAIAYAHEMLGFERPWLKSHEVKREIDGLRREKDEDRQKRNGIEREDATDILLKLNEPTALFDVRDRAIFCLTWLTALRRSNVARLRRRDVSIRFDMLEEQRYLDVYVSSSKTDQEGRGRHIKVPEIAGSHPLCAVRALDRWFRMTDLDPDGPLFPSATLARDEAQRRLTQNAIDPRDVTRIVKRIVKRAGLSPELYAAHSLRRGFATSMQNAGIPDAVAMKHGGWKSKDTYYRYNRVNEERHNAVRDLFEPKK
jgi:integrase